MNKSTPEQLESDCVLMQVKSLTWISLWPLTVWAVNHDAFQSALREQNPELCNRQCAGEDAPCWTSAHCWGRSNWVHLLKYFTTLTTSSIIIWVISYFTDYRLHQLHLQMCWFLFISFSLFLSPGMFQSCQTSSSKCCKSNIIIIIIIITIITIVTCYCNKVLEELNLFIWSDKWFEFNDLESILPQISTWNICCSLTT